MTALAVAASSHAGGATGGTRRRRSIAVVVGVVLVLVALAVAERDSATYGGALDPRNPDGDGARAVARVLDAHGVEVRVVRGQQALLAEPVHGDTGVVVTNTAALGPSTLRRLRAHARGAGSLVLVGDPGWVSVSPGLGRTSLSAGRHAAGCGEPLVRRLVLQTHGGTGWTASGCFRDGTASALVHRGRMWLLASPTSISNRHVLEADNAALALRLLGQQDRLLWYVADPADLAVGEGLPVSRLLPSWLGPAALLVACAVLALMLWRGRRLGPVVREPLPAVVRAAESTYARGRLYRRTGDGTHAGTILVQATRRRLATALGVPRSAPPEALDRAVAARTGRNPDEVRRLLSTPDALSDAGLAELGRTLTALENEVRQP